MVIPDLEIFISLGGTFIVAFGAIISALSMAYTVYARKKMFHEEETTEDRVEKLTKNLQEATKIISNIESEVKERSAIADKLQKDIKHYDKLAKLKKSDIEAVTQLLRGELEKSNKKSFWAGFATNFLFFALGAVVTIIVAMFF